MRDFAMEGDAGELEPAGQITQPSARGTVTVDVQHQLGIVELEPPVGEQGDLDRVQRFEQPGGDEACGKLRRRAIGKGAGVHDVGYHFSLEALVAEFLLEIAGGDDDAVDETQHASKETAPIAEVVPGPPVMVI